MKKTDYTNSSWNRYGCTLKMLCIYALIGLSLTIIFTSCSKDSEMPHPDEPYYDQYIENLQAGNMPPGMSYEEFVELVESVNQANQTFNPTGLF